MSWKIDDPLQAGPLLCRPQTQNLLCFFIIFFLYIFFFYSTINNLLPCLCDTMVINTHVEYKYVHIHCELLRKKQVGILILGLEVWKRDWTVTVRDTNRGWPSLAVNHQREKRESNNIKCYKCVWVCLVRALDFFLFLLLQNTTPSLLFIKNRVNAFY